MNTEKQRAFIIHVVYLCIIFAMLYVFLRYIIYAIMPFLIGFLIAYILRPIIKVLINKYHGHEKLWSTIVILLFYATIGAFVTLLSIKGFAFLKDFVQDLPDLYQTYIEPYLQSTITNVQTVWKGVDMNSAQAIESFLEGLQNSIYSILSSLSESLVSFFTNFATSLPNIIISFFFAIISSFFFNADYQKILSFLIRQLPDRGKKIVYMAQQSFTTTIRRFVIAYAKIMTLTFIELTIGLSIMGIDNAVVIAFLIAVFDVIPVLGTGGIMIPWIIICFLNQQIKTAIGLLIIYLIVTLIRNIIEPKIVGHQIGLHPLLMLLCMYLGAKLFGFLGIITLPVLIMIIINLNDSGIIHLYNP